MDTKAGRKKIFSLGTLVVVVAVVSFLAGAFVSGDGIGKGSLSRSKSDRAYFSEYEAHVVAPCIEKLAFEHSSIAKRQEGREFLRALERELETRFSFDVLPTLKEAEGIGVENLMRVYGAKRKDCTARGERRMVAMWQRIQSEQAAKLSALFDQLFDGDTFAEVESFASHKKHVLKPCMVTLALDFDVLENLEMQSRLKEVLNKSAKLFRSSDVTWHSIGDVEFDTYENSEDRLAECKEEGRRQLQAITN